MTDDQWGIVCALLMAVAIVAGAIVAVCIRRQYKRFDWESEPLKMHTVYETFIPNEMFLNHMEMIKISAEWEDIPVLAFCENLLMRGQ